MKFWLVAAILGLIAIACDLIVAADEWARAR